MHNKPNIWFVDSHSKCDCSDDDIDLLVQKVILVLHANVWIETSMVWRRFKPVYIQELSDLFYFLPAQTVDYPRFALVFLKEFDELLLGLFLWPYLVVEVFTVER